MHIYYLKCTYFILKHIYMTECIDVFVYLFSYFNKYHLEKNKPSTIQGLFCSSFLFRRKRKREKKGSYLRKFWWSCFVLGNRQKGGCHFNSLVLSFTIIFKVIFLVVAPEITTHIWNCNNLAQINTDLVSILYQNFTPTALFPTPSFVLLLSYKLDLYTLYAHQHRFIIVLCSCLLNQMGEKKKELQRK